MPLVDSHNSMTDCCQRSMQDVLSEQRTWLAHLVLWESRRGHAHKSMRTVLVKAAVACSLQHAAWGTARATYATARATRCTRVGRNCGSVKLGLKQPHGIILILQLAH
jgi:hypothetical protein